MADWGGYKAILEEAKAIEEDERNKPPVACPNDGTPLEYHATKGVLHCPMGDYQIAASRR